MSEIIRPEWDEFRVSVSGAQIMCNCGFILYTQIAMYQHWQEGHFDFVQPDRNHYEYVYPDSTEEK